VQGVGGAIIAPTALALITTNFPQGGERNRAFSVYAAMAGAGASVGLLLGGILTTYVPWRWCLFVNVPIGIVVAAAAPRVLNESPRRPGQIDVAGAITGTGGVALLVYGLSRATTGADGISHWGDAQVLAALTASVALLVSFVFIEMHSSHPLLPMRVLADRNRSGAYLIMLCIATGLFGLFFFLTLFIQTVLGYSAIRTGVSYLPFAVGVVVASALASPLVARLGPRPLILVGSAAVAGGMFWLSGVNEHSGYASHLLGPQLVISLGLGLVFVPLSLVALYKVGEKDAGVAAAAAKAGRPLPKPGTPLPASIYKLALTVGFSRGFVVAAGIALLALLIGIATIRVSRRELAGATPEPQEAAPQPTAPESAALEPTASQPGTVQLHEDQAALAAAVRPCRLC